MGSLLSKPFQDLTKEEVAKIVTELGDRYKAYSTLLVDHGVDGGLLDSLDETGLQETMDDLGISNRLHRRVLQRLLGKATGTLLESPSCCPRHFLERYTKTETVASAFDLAIGKEEAASHLTTSHLNRETLALNLKQASELSTFTKPKYGCDLACDIVDPSNASNNVVRHKNTNFYDKGQSLIGCSDTVHCGHIAKLPSSELVAVPKRHASHELPIFQALLGNADDRVHLSSNFYDMVDALKAPRPPIPRNDIERSAAVEALGLTDISPSDEIAHHLETMVKMATEVFGFPYGEITFHNHEFQFRIASYCAGENPFSALNAAYQSLRSRPDGKPFLCKTGRGATLCNYTIAAGRTFVIKDVAADETFAWLNTLVPVRCYVGSPIKDSAGRVIADLCLFDTKTRQDFEAAHEIQIAQFSSIIAQSIESWAIARAVEKLEIERTKIAQGHTKTGPPKGNVTLVITDIQGSTALWESDPVAMQAALDLHDSTIRRLCAEYWGHEIETEGDAFTLAFHDPVDAIAFALSTQVALFEANWSQDILRFCEAKEESGAFRGLRVRMAVHHGHISTDESGRACYFGGIMNLTKSLASIASGGQILTTSEIWDLASYFLGKKLGYPQVVDLGAYVLQTGKTMRDGLMLSRIIQLVPLELAYDYFAARKLVSPRDELRLVPRSGRRFSHVSSCKQVSPSFHDAPHENNEVTVAFVNLSHVADRHMMALRNRISLLLDRCKEFHGYHCGKEMLVFRHPLDAVMFGLRLRSDLCYREQSEDGATVAQLIQYGCIHGDFLTMGPHRKTGRADYFGQIVNRAARLSSAVAPGSVCLGVVCCGDQNDQEGSVSPIHHPSIEAQFCGRKSLRGIQKEIDVFEFNYAVSKQQEMEYF